jgi:hypothetical protein
MEMKHHLQVAEHLAKVLENRFEIFGFKFGIEPLIGLIPWIGDVIAFALSLYIVWIANQMKLPKNVIATMYRNVVLDLLLGLVPVVGDISDFIYKANSRNLELLLKHKDMVREGEIVESSLPSYR